jgi:hypothetical protein
MASPPDYESDMRLNHTAERARLDPVAGWANDLRTSLVVEVSPERAHEIAAVAAGVATSLSLATAAGAAINLGGTTMSTVIGAAAASHTTMKIAAGSLVAALAAGGAAVATGNLSIGTAEAETRSEGALGVNAGLVEEADAGADLQIEIIAVEGLGTVEVALDGSTLQVLDVRGAAGVVAQIRSQTEGSAEIDFTRDGETRTLLVTVANGEIATSVTSSARSDADADMSSESEGAVGASSDVEIDVSVGTRIGIGEGG